ncbi:MAG: glycoside hydrolase family 78 protein [Thermofilaceae archaeon]|nr:glycoside hydrolase family 78 protein [Thermofilaceae archaeon]
MTEIPPPSDLRCEYFTDPVGVDPDAPLRFTWILYHFKRGAKQKAFQVIVSDSITLVEKGLGNVWDSGVVESAENFTTYSGIRLESGREYYWRVRWWDQDGNVSSWSSIAKFTTALRPGDWKAKWVTGGRLLRKEFEVPAPVKKALVHVTGLGYYELRINGRKVGDRVLDPLWTEYNKRVLYATYDVTEYIRQGRNAAGLILGRGRYVKAYGYDEVLKAILQMKIELVNGQVIELVTDESWKASEGPVLEDDIYNGEVYDARREQDGWDQPAFDDSSWANVDVVDHKATLVPSGAIPPIKKVCRIPAKRILNPSPGVYVFDFGQNIAGWVRIRAIGPRGTRIQLRYSELIDEKGNIDVRNLRGAKATDVYVMRGGGVEFYEPRFTYHGFRFVEVTGFPGVPTLDSIEAVVVHSDVEPTGSFASSNELLNEIHKLVVWSIKSNLMGVPTDCPQRDERMGWGGDAQLTAEVAMLNFWMPGFYEKWLDDWADAQLGDGSVPDVVPPYWKLYPADPAWGEAYVLIPRLLYEYYLDRSALSKHYERIKKWVEYILGRTDGYILSFSKYGDWCPPRRIKALETPGELISTWVLYNDLVTLSEAAVVLDKVEEASWFKELAYKVREAFNKEFLRDNKYYVSSSSQTCNVLPLASDIVPQEAVKEVFSTLVRDVEIEKDGHLDTGIIGTRYLLTVLSEYGRPDLAYIVATQASYPSWGYMVREGATTLWERWELLRGSAMNSHNHHMFGSIDTYFYKCLAGIKRLKPGFKEFAVKPDPIELERVAASIRPLTGVISAEIIRKSGKVIVKASVPVGSLALIHVPVHGWRNPVVTESGMIVWSDGKVVEFPEGVEEVFQDEGYLVFKVGSGNYLFEAFEAR